MRGEGGGGGGGADLINTGARDRPCCLKNIERREGAPFGYLITEVR